MKILVTGGTGYIGSITVRELQKKGYEVVVFDNLVAGHKESVNCKVVEGDLTDPNAIEALTESFDAVIHFAAYALAGESMENPYKYFYNNTVGGLNLLEFMRKKGIKKIIFSSTSAVYGYPEKLPVLENAPKHPESVYGESKLQFESILKWYDKIFGIKNICLRYFNAAGASLDGSLGEDHVPESHLIPVAIRSAIEGAEFSLFGNDYDSSDGTCIRDYVHIEDLATAHIAAVEHLSTNNISDVFNIGYGRGYSNLEVIKMIEKVGGKKLNVVIASRRAGDPAIIYGDVSKAKNVLGFEAKHSDLETIIKTAWNWHIKHPQKNE